MSRQQVALITGASSGFGMLTAVALAKAGFLVAATMRDPRKRDKLLAAALEADVADLIVYFKLDVTLHEEVQQTVQSIIDSYGSIDLLVNNAGFAEGGVVEEVIMPHWRAQMETNFFGAVAVIQAVLPIMRTQRAGLIINISSISGQLGLPGFGPYAASKFAIEGLSETLRHEMRPFGVKVVLVEPGAYQTEIWDKGFSSFTLAEESPYMRQLEAVLRYARNAAAKAPDAREVAQFIVHLTRVKQPKLRYPVGRGVRASMLVKALLPWRTFEKLITLILNSTKPS